METVESNEYYDVLWDGENRLLVYKWKDTIMDLDEESYKEGFLDSTKFLYQYEPLRVIHDSRTHVYPITPELQKWITENITPKYREVGIKRVAYVMPHEFLTRLALEQLVLKLLAFKEGIKRMFFDDYDNALRWVMK